MTAVPAVRAAAWSPTYDTFAALVRVQTDLWTDVEREVRSAGGPSLAQVSVLQLVATTPGCRVSDVVSAMHITVGGASKVVDRLVGGGYLARRAHPHDGRSSLLEVTDRGAGLLDGLSGAVDDALRRRLTEPLGASGVQRLAELLGTLAGTRTETQEASR